MSCSTGDGDVVPTCNSDIAKCKHFKLSRSKAILPLMLGICMLGKEKVMFRNRHENASAGVVSLPHELIGSPATIVADEDNRRIKSFGSKTERRRIDFVDGVVAVDKSMTYVDKNIAIIDNTCIIEVFV